MTQREGMTDACYRVTKRLKEQELFVCDHLSMASHASEDRQCCNSAAS